ncbi:sensor histidine kinase [Alkaliphilus oremlandii]|uniref:Signal transduction histidine kinase regulating citrate/malate metabolism n=1 Tax=Alkaliphilus oremlandii (strain OhILAs) TaxID=350688 RepID=A8MLS2_ALKOO|nr:sensor histidine kinase [Alkaliphilus oremlandii]ABW17989.1 signal transduction histidine kinase regulating citrate/malate metabolism [Alkaliphilus oremlandii OhILAs]
MENLLMMNIFTNTLDIYALYYFLKKILGKTEKNEISVFSLLSIAIVLSTLINTKAGLVKITSITTMTIVLTLIFNWIFSKSKLSKSFALVIMGLTLMFLIELIVVNGLSVFFKISPKLLLEVNFYKLMAVILTKLLFITVVSQGENLFKEMYTWIKQLNIYPVSILIIVNLCIVFMTFIFYSYIDIGGHRELIYIIGMGGAAVVVSCVIAWIIKKMIEQQNKEFLFQIKEKEYENQQIYLDHIQEVIQTLRAQRHDFNNYVSTIYGLIHLGKIEEAKKYILNLSKDVVDLNEIVNACHPVVGAILNMKKEKAARSKIDFNVDVDLPTKLPFEFVDISTILGNLLDNAIEACEKISNDCKKIYIQIYIKDFHMIIKIENSKSDQVILKSDNLIGYLTTKLDKENHGLGLKNVRKAVLKYDGMLNIEDKGKEFLVDIALPLKEVLVEVEA